MTAVFPQGYWENKDMWPWEHYKLVNLAAVCERAAEFDVIQYQMADYPMSMTFSRLVKTPIVQTLHRQPEPEQGALWQHYPEANFVAVSECQRSALKGLNCVATIAHGVDLEHFRFNGALQDYLVYLGRFSPDKGILQAIKVARRTGLHLRLAGPENEYYHEAVKQHLDGQFIEYLGELRHADKTKLLGGACAGLPNSARRAVWAGAD